MHQRVPVDVFFLLDSSRSPFGMPFFFGMIDMLINKFPGYPFYGYINGDILVENTIKDVLEQVYADILSGKLGPKVSLFTHRKNMFASFPDDLYNNNSESREYFPLSLFLSPPASSSPASIAAASRTGTWPSYEAALLSNAGSLRVHSLGVSLATDAQFRDRPHEIR